MCPLLLRVYRGRVVRSRRPAPTRALARLRGQVFPRSRGLQEGVLPARTRPSPGLEFRPSSGSEAERLQPAYTAWPRDWGGGVVGGQDPTVVERSCAAVSLTSPAGSLPRSHLQESRRGPRDQAAGPRRGLLGATSTRGRRLSKKSPAPFPGGQCRGPDSLPQSTWAAGHRVVSLMMPASFHWEPQRLARHLSAVAPAPRQGQSCSS